MSRPVITKDGDKIEQLPGGTVRTGSATPTEIAERKVEDKALADAAKFKKFNDAIVAENKARVLPTAGRRPISDHAPCQSPVRRRRGAGRSGCVDS